MKRDVSFLQDSVYSGEVDIFTDAV